jgi:nucleoside-diphosphate-sugar epimerase
MIYLVGGEGFVGSAWARLFQRLELPHRILTRQNMDAFRGTACALLINANGNSKKYLSDREPMTDFDQSVRSVADTLHSIRAERYVFLSSGDVYPRQDSPAVTAEPQEIDLAETSRYGRHKRLAEILVQTEHRDWLIFRMGGFVGPGLRKNAIFDIMNHAPVWLTPDSALQFIRTDSAAALAWSVIEAGTTGEVINMGATGVVRLMDVHQAFKSKSLWQETSRHVRFELALDKLARHSTLAVPETSDEILAFLRPA